MHIIHAAEVPSNRRGAGVVERGGLENRCAFTGTEGSNPSLSAMKEALIFYAHTPPLTIKIGARRISGGAQTHLPALSGLVWGLFYGGI